MTVRAIPNPARAPLAYYGQPVDLHELLPGAVILHGDHAIHVITDAGAAFNVARNETDAYGSPSWLIRQLDPRPGYTRHMLGQHELERDRRHHPR